MYLIFGIQNLLNQKYVRESEREKLKDLGFNQEAVIRGVESKGMNIEPLVLDTNNTNATYLCTLKTPLLITARSYMAFCGFVYSTFNDFKKIFIMLLKQLPVMLCVNVENRTSLVKMDMAQILALCYPQWEWQFRLNGITYRYDTPDSIQNASEGFKGNVKNIIDTILPEIISKAVGEKCYNLYDKRLHNGFYIINTFNRTILWVNASQTLWSDWSPNVIGNKILELAKANLVNAGIEALNQLTYQPTEPTFEQINFMIQNVQNPLSIFGSLQEDDFKAIGNLFGYFFNIYKDEYGMKNESSPFFASLIRFCFSTEKSPAVTTSTETITARLNEVTSRKIINITKITSKTFIESTQNYVAYFIIPMQLSTYKIKWYLKRNFAEFFRFFDSVYFKPEYLKMLTQEGLNILKRLSTFDSNVIDALTLTVK